jgi:hypothetical protein
MVCVAPLKIGTARGISTARRARTHYWCSGAKAPGRIRTLDTFHYSLRLLRDLAQLDDFFRVHDNLLR